MSSVFAWNSFSSSSLPNDTIKKAEYHTPERDSKPPVCLRRHKEQIRNNRYTCPRVNELYKDGMRWKTDTGWNGYQDSFASEIASFMGAQWKGVGIGRVICLYNSTDDNEFPIQIATTKLINRPPHAYWENEPNKDFINCISKASDPCDCQFSYYIENKEQDVNKIIDSLEKQ